MSPLPLHIHCNAKCKRNGLFCPIASIEHKHTQEEETLFINMKLDYEVTKECHYDSKYAVQPMTTCNKNMSEMNETVSTEVRAKKVVLQPGDRVIRS